ncbi:FbpB family small basic protein [Bacillus salitolerans]|uniref:FbpB family small basic protein n=1 Tax=Bacillus salitolerans TaxID=1437434 RepID=A0ABW4LSV1_9BACI
MKRNLHKKMKLSMNELVKRNKEEIMRDVKELEKIEKRIEEKKSLSY